MPLTAVFALTQTLHDFDYGIRNLTPLQKRAMRMSHSHNGLGEAINYSAKVVVLFL